MTVLIWGIIIGFIAGIIATLAILVPIGKRQANKAAEIIDKKIQDAAINQNI